MPEWIDPDYIGWLEAQEPPAVPWRDRLRLALDQPIVEQSMTWVCAKCGKRPWSHAEHCACGAARPEPPPAAEPTDIALAEEWR